MSKRIIFYYKASLSLEEILYENTPITHIHLGAINFDLDINNTATIYLNDYKPFDIIYYNVWNEMDTAYKLGIKIILILGGIAGVYTRLFSNFEKYYNCLCLLIRGKAIFSGIELNIEDNCTLNNIRYLICRLIGDFGEDFLISITARQECLETDYPDKCSFIYRDLLISSQGKYINYINGQFFIDYTLDAYNDVVDNGYKPEKLIMGMKGCEDISDLSKIVKKYGDKFGGVSIFEFYYGKSSLIEMINHIDRLLNYPEYHEINNMNDMYNMNEMNNMNEINKKKNISCLIS